MFIDETQLYIWIKSEASEWAHVTWDDSLNGNYLYCIWNPEKNIHVVNLSLSCTEFSFPQPVNNTRFFWQVSTPLQQCQLLKRSTRLLNTSLTPQWRCIITWSLLAFYAQTPDKLQLWIIYRSFINKWRATNPSQWNKKDFLAKSVSFCWSDLLKILLVYAVNVPLYIVAGCFCWD